MEQTNQINVLLCSESSLILYGLRKIIESDKSINLAFTINSFDDLVHSIKSSNDLICIIDENLLGFSSNKTIKSLVAPGNNIKILLLLKPGNYTEDRLVELLVMGVMGYINNMTKEEDIIKAIHSISDGELWAPRKIISKALSKIASYYLKRNLKYPVKDGLTKREIQIAGLAASGYKNKQISKLLYISENTVKSHMVNIFRKLGIKSRSQFVDN